jgi:hypothetical protein
MRDLGRMAPVGFWGLLGKSVRAWWWDRMGMYLLDDDEFGVFFDERFELFEIGQPFVVRVGFPE